LLLSGISDEMIKNLEFSHSTDMLKNFKIPGRELYVLELEVPKSISDRAFLILKDFGTDPIEELVRIIVSKDNIHVDVDKNYVNTEVDGFIQQGRYTKDAYISVLNDKDLYEASFLKETFDLIAGAMYL